MKYFFLKSLTVIAVFAAAALTQATAAQPGGEADAGESAGSVTLVVSADSPFPATEFVAKLEAAAGVRTVETVLVVEAQDGTTVLGVETGRQMRLPVEGQLHAASILRGGRGFREGDAGQPVMLAGKAFAESHDTAFGYPIAGMIGHNPPYFLEGRQVLIVGMFATGSDVIDNAVVLPLAFARELFGQPGRASALVVTVSADEVATVERIVREALGEAARVAVPQ